MHGLEGQKLTAVCTGLLALFAQPTAAQSPALPGPPADETVVELSPFEVSSSQDVGYLAANTLAGSRLNQSLKDTAASISVLTPEFLADIAAFDLTEAVDYAVNVELEWDDDRSAVNGNASVNEYQGYRVRSLTSTIARDYFESDVPPEMALVERVEDSRGPNTVLFGIAEPGGLLNVSTKRAHVGRSFHKGSFSIGSYNLRRATLDLNQALLGRKLAVRFNAVYNRTGTFREGQFTEHRRAQLGVRYIIADKTRIQAEFERGQLDSNVPRAYVNNSFLLWDRSGRPTFATQAANTGVGVTRLSTAANDPRVTYIANTDATIAMRGALATSSAGPDGGGLLDERIASASINLIGSDANRYSRFNDIAASLEHQLSRSTFLKLDYKHQDHLFDRYDPRNGNPNALKGDPNQRLNDGTPNPFAGGLYLETNWYFSSRRTAADTGRMTLAQGFDAKKWGNYRFVANADYRKSFIGSGVYEEKWVDAATGLPAFNLGTPENTQNNVWRRHYVTEGAWATYAVNGPGTDGLLSGVIDPVTGRTLSSAWIIASSSQPAERYSTGKASALTGQARYFSGRLIAMAGVRRDERVTRRVKSARDPVTRIWTLARALEGGQTRTEATKETLGLVYHVTPRLSVSYNRATNVTIPAENVMILGPSGEPGSQVPPPPPVGEGQDYSVGLELLEGRLYAKATYYTTLGKGQHTTFSNVVRSANERIVNALQSAGLITREEAVARNLPGASNGTFDHHSEGLEGQVTANVTKNWRFQANYSQTQSVQENMFLEWKAWDAQNVRWLAPFDTARITSSGGRSISEEIALYQSELAFVTSPEGVGKLGNRRHKVSLFTRYNLPFRWLKGAYIGGGYRHQSKMFVGQAPDGRKLYGNSFWRADLLAGYRVGGLRKGRALSFQLNIKDAFTDGRPLITRYNDNGIGVLRQVTQSPTTWRLTANFEL